ncbi:GPO family capsid scaffolding protein [Thiothrix sp.]|jgi:hypothetical protein|uniref:GPO family capsid scaffolding protein n=1 Tax=Thiothrix sp. TaxID=1032 RepID=UPI002579745C|nr:GPO family capsid scaffolding protein [Thiothrix sp.]
MAKLISDFFCVAMSGKTIDGRDISPEWLLQAAKEYNPELYASRIWFEHIRYFGAFGDIVAVRAEKADNGVIKIYNRISPSPELINMKRNGQALYSSIEIIPKLERTGKAYQIGLGVTDSPASFGTDRMEFSANSQRHLEKDSLFTASMEVPDLDFQTERTLFDFGRFFGKKPPAETKVNESNETDPHPPTDPQETDDMTLEELNAALDKKLGEQHDKLKNEFASQLETKLEAATKPLVEKLTAQDDELKSLKEKQDKVIELATPPNGNQHQDHPPHGGGDPDKQKHNW